MLENGLFSWVLFCVRSLGPLERCDPTFDMKHLKHFHSLHGGAICLILFWIKAGSGHYLEFAILNTGARDTRYPNKQKFPSLHILFSILFDPL